MLATTVSCSVALGLNSLVPRLRNLKPITRTVFTRLVPFAAVVSAGIVNVFLMRIEEIYHGIYVMDKDGHILGTSPKAGLLAVSETAASRALNATPVMAIPPLLLLRLQRTQWLKRHPRMTIPVNLALILGVSLVALPCAIGAFPQRQRIHVSKLEPEFHDRETKSGEKIEYVWFNRGV
jgi:sideroflexin-5